MVEEPRQRNWVQWPLKLLVLGFGLSLLAACGASCYSQSGAAAQACHERLQDEAETRERESGFHRG
ncbi:MAG: hypothetical protein Kilf2KO_11520 [Rhodospirillales bacterium]